MYTSVPELRSDLLNRLRQGDHVVLYGPRGAGKTTLAEQIQERLRRDHVPCGLCRSTASLNDITRTMASAYPDVETGRVSRRTARARLREAGYHQGCVLLLDHVTEVSTAMVGFGRQLRGRIAGVLYVVDVDAERERQWIRQKRLALTARMPPLSLYQLRKLLRSRCVTDGIAVSAGAEQRILKNSRGRPGWIVKATLLMKEPRYWHDGQLYPNLLCTDTEITMRQAELDLLAPSDWNPQSGRAWPNPHLKEVELWKRQGQDTDEPITRSSRHRTKRDFE